MNTSLILCAKVTWLASWRREGSTQLTWSTSDVYCCNKQTAAGKNRHLIVELSIATEAQLTMACKMSQSSSTIEKVTAICVPE